MSKHTPGPWKSRASGARSASFSVIAEMDERLVASVPPRFHGPGDSDGQANARLIAAAPDLLEACALTINRVCQLCYLGVAFVSIGTHQVPDGGITPCQAVYLRSVVAKATGGQP